jgi:hypothetical protein
MTTNGIDSIHNSEQGPQDGLTKREYFAALAMQGICATLEGGVSISENMADLLAKESVRVADALISQLNKTPTNETP